MKSCSFGYYNSKLGDYYAMVIRRMYLHTCIDKGYLNLEMCNICYTIRSLGFGIC